jgi:heat shock protein HspQ
LLLFDFLISFFAYLISYLNPYLILPTLVIMKSDIIIPRAKYAIGQTVRHTLFNYRAVVADIDPVFNEAAHKYDEKGIIQPRKDHPWYHVLVHGTAIAAYVPEGYLERDTSEQKIAHPALDLLFDAFEDGRYQSSATLQ